MKQSPHSRKGSSAVLVIDPLELRRAAVASLLKPWADANGMDIAEIDPHGALSQRGASTLRNTPPFRMIVLVLGAQGVGDLEPQKWIRSLRATYTGVPLVLVSDREETGEVVTAFKAGVRGFIPTTIASPVAIQTFTFIMNGGSFFPPVALTEATRTDRVVPAGAGKDLVMLAAQHRNGLTARQQEVLEHLQQGASNKLIGRQLRLRESTVKVHIRQIMRKLGATNRTQAALCAAQLSRPETGENGAGADKDETGPDAGAPQTKSALSRPPDEAGTVPAVRASSPRPGSFTMRARSGRVLRPAALRSTPLR